MESELLRLVVVLIVLGLIGYVVRMYAPLDAGIKQIIMFVLGAVAVYMIVKFLLVLI